MGPSSCGVWMKAHWARDNPPLPQKSVAPLALGCINQIVPLQQHKAELHSWKQAHCLRVHSIINSSGHTSLGPERWAKLPFCSDFPLIRAWVGGNSLKWVLALLWLLKSDGFGWGGNAIKAQISLLGAQTNLIRAAEHWDICSKEAQGTNTEVIFALSATRKPWMWPHSLLLGAQEQTQTSSLQPPCELSFVWGLPFPLLLH